MSQMMAGLSSIHSVMDNQYGGVGDGLTDDTAAIQAAIDAAVAAGGETVLIPGGNIYRVTGQPLLSNLSGLTIDARGATILLDGVGAEGMRFAGTNNDITIDGLTVIGSGVAAHNQQGFGTTVGTAPAGGSGIKLLNCKADNVARGFYFDVLSVLGDFRKMQLVRPTATRIVGTGSGQGYGIALSGVYDSVIDHPFTDQTGRHAIYISVCKGIVLTGPMMRRHRDGGIATGSQTSALAIARSNGVTVFGIDAEDCLDGALTIEPHETDVDHHSTGIEVIGGSIRNTIGAANMIDAWIGSGSPATASELRVVKLIGITFERTELASVATELVRIRAVNDFLMQGCTFRAPNAYTVSKHMVLIAGDGAATYTKNVKLKDNHTDMTLGVAGGGAFALLGTPMCTGVSRVTCEDNTTSEAAILQLACTVPVGTEDVVERRAPFSRTPPTLATGDIHDYERSTASMLRFTAHASGTRLCSLLGGVHGLRIKILKIGGGTFTLGHEIAGGANPEDMILSPTGADITIADNNSRWIEYDGLTQRWRVE